MAPTTLITGAGGFLGRELCEAFCRAGHRLVLVDRSLPSPDGRVDCEHVRVKGDIRSLGEYLFQSTRGVRIDNFIHAAAVTAAPPATPEGVVAYVEEHLLAAGEVLRAAARHGASALFVGSAAVFAAEQQGPLNEDVCPEGLGPYATAKLASERLWLDARGAGLRAGVVRLGNLFGPGERPTSTRPRMSLLRRFIGNAQGEGVLRVESPRALRDWTYVPDAAARFVDLLEGQDGPPELTHVVNPEHKTDLQLARKIAQLVEGARVEVAEVAGPAAPRGVLASERAVVGGTWTPLDKALRASFPDDPSREVRA